MSRRRWGAVLALGVVMIPVAVWTAYAITQSASTTTGTDLTESVWPIIAFFVAFVGGILVTVGSLGFTFSWFSGHDEDDNRPSPAETLARAVPTTRVGWRGDAAEADGP